MDTQRDEIAELMDKINKLTEKKKEFGDKKTALD